MKWKVYAILLLCPLFLHANECTLANDRDNQIILNTKSGLLKIYRFGGIKPEKEFSIGEDIFTTKQMENKAASVVWEVTRRNKGSITLCTTLKKETAGIDLDGIKYQKTFQFDPAVPEIKVTMEFQNISEQLRYAYWGIRNQFQLRPKNSEVVFIPRTIGTFPQSSWLFLNFYAQLPAWSSSIAENWCAKMDVQGKNGLGFLLDSAAQSSFYSFKGQNIGFMFDGGYMAPQAFVKTAYKIRPIQHLAGVTTVNSSFAAYISNGKTKTTASVFPYESGEFSGEFTIVDENRKPVFHKKVNLHLKKGVCGSVDFTHPGMKNHFAVILKSKMNGKEFSTEQYFENGVRMQDIAACPFTPCFMRPAVTRTKTEAIAYEMMPVRKKQAVCLFGLYTPFNRFDKILDGWKIDTYSVWNTGMKEIPPASTLDEYSILIISNAFINGMEVCLPRVKRFVANGGLLLVTGGPSAFGTGGYEKNSFFNEMLPVSGRAFDLQPVAGKGQFDKGVAIAGKGINSLKAPYLYWMHHFAKINPSAEILWQVGQHPVLIKGAYQKGRILCFLGAPLGDPKDGSTPYWESEEYVSAMRKIIMETLKEIQK